MRNDIKKVVAGVLTASMVMGATTPAFAEVAAVNSHAVLKSAIVVQDEQKNTQSSWVKIGSSSEQIDTSTAKNSDEVAGKIADGVSKVLDECGFGWITITATNIISKIGRATLGLWIEQRVGLYTNCTLYQMVASGGVVQYRAHWWLSDEAGRVLEGPYDNYFNGPIYSSAEDETMKK
ncbi:MAG: hypothetical protein IKU46_04955 [Peptococcaceae bacterium]|nr:hypothetical protein [Peptococcaceae bacterium]